MIKIEDGDWCKGCKLVDKYNELEKENNEQDEYIKYWQEQCDLKQRRIDKAIKILEQDGNEYTCVDHMCEAIWILQGNSNE